METTIKPLRGYVLIKQTDAAKKTATGIYIPDGSQEAPIEGTVIRVGESTFTDEGLEIVSPVVVGDTVIWKRWGGDEIKDGDTEYKLVKFEDLMALREEADGKS